MGAKLPLLGKHGGGGVGGNKKTEIWLGVGERGGVENEMIGLSMG